MKNPPFEFILHIIPYSVNPIHQNLNTDYGSD